MALISCPECGYSISDKAFSCPSCGYPINIPSTIVTAQPTPKRKAKRHRKLPNGSGSIKHLSGKRSKPWAAYPPVAKFTINGSPVLGAAIGYFRTYDEAYQALMLYNNSPDDIRKSTISFSDLCAAMLSNRSSTISFEYANVTFAELYEQYFENKYQKSKKKLSNASKDSTRAAFKNCKTLHDRKFVELRKADLQNVVDTCPLKHSSLELIVSLFKGMYSYALQNDIIEKDYSQFVTINIPDDDESGVPFSPDALNTLWQHSDQKVVGMILLMIYTGFRIAAFRNITYNEAEQYFQGGVKTVAGKTGSFLCIPPCRDLPKYSLTIIVLGIRFSQFRHSVAAFIRHSPLWDYPCLTQGQNIHHTTADIPSHGSVINITLMICQNTY